MNWTATSILAIAVVALNPRCEAADAAGNDVIKKLIAEKYGDVASMLHEPAHWSAEQVAKDRTHITEGLRSSSMISAA